ncbi:MAG: hypothetical protein JW751_05745 [Polyangiaceae bacterium]|nr:hypothetical protein [Polyangiaceae bacterium]
MPPVSGAYSMAAPKDGAVAVDCITGLHERERASATRPVSGRVVEAIIELRQRPLAALMLSPDRRLLGANASAKRLLELDLGLDVDCGRVRCTDSRQAGRFAKAVHEAARRPSSGHRVVDVIELGSPGSVAWLDIVITSPRDRAVGEAALVVVRCRG